MKNKILLLLTVAAFITNINAQDTGKIIIRNAANSYPKFIASLNGIRLINEYSDVQTFSYLDDTRYRLKLFQAGSGNLLTFTLSSEPKYLSKYLITKDNAGNYSVILESKSLMLDEPEPVVTNTLVADPAVIHTVVTMPPVISQTAVTITNMSKAEFDERLVAVKKTSFDDKRLAKAKQVYHDETLSTSQVIEVVKVFSFDDSKLDFAKWAYKNTIDPKNYYKLDDHFSFSGTKTALADFIMKQAK